MNDRITPLAWLFGWCFMWLVLQSMWYRNCISHERLAIIRECADRPKVVYNYDAGTMNVTTTAWLVR